MATKKEIETWEEIARIGEASQTPGGPTWKFRVERAEQLLTDIRNLCEDEENTASQCRTSIEERLHDFFSHLLNDHVRSEYERQRGEAELVEGEQRGD